MSQSEIDNALQAAFEQCRSLGYALSEAQQQILRQVVPQRLIGAGDRSDDGANPLGELTPEEREQLMRYIQAAQVQSTSWKVLLLNDWLGGRDSGSVQFIRDRYGLQWLDRVEPQHLAPYLDDSQLPLQVGDRIEVSNGLWEWVQEEGPCQREWVPCRVVSLSEGDCISSAIVRFQNGMEYQIQGIYDWNRYQWRRQRS